MGATSGQVKAGSAYVELFSKDATDVGIRTAQAKLDGYAQHVQTIQAKIAAATAAGNAQQAAGLQRALATIQGNGLSNGKQGAAALAVQLLQKSGAAMAEAGVAFRGEDIGPLARQNVSLGNKPSGPPAASGGGLEQTAVKLAAIAATVRVVGAALESVAAISRIMREGGNVWEAVFDAVKTLPIIGSVAQGLRAIVQELNGTAAAAYNVKQAGEKAAERLKRFVGLSESVQKTQRATEDLDNKDKPYAQAITAAKREYDDEMKRIKALIGPEASATGVNKARAQATNLFSKRLADADKERSKAADEKAKGIAEDAAAQARPGQDKLADLTRQVETFGKSAGEVTIMDATKLETADDVLGRIVEKVGELKALQDVADEAKGITAALEEVDAAFTQVDEAEDQFIRNLRESLKTPEQKFTEEQRKILTMVDTGRLTGAEGGASITALEGRFRPELPASVKGTFSGAAAAMALGGGAPIDRIAQATEATAKTTDRLFETVSRQQLSFVQ